MHASVCVGVIKCYSGHIVVGSSRDLYLEGSSMFCKLTSSDLTDLAAYGAMKEGG